MYGERDGGEQEQNTDDNLYEHSGFRLPHTRNALAPFYADRIKNERSALAGREGDKIASANVSLKEVPDLKEGRVCRRIDDEGIPVKEKYLIKEGIFKTQLVNKELAKKLKIEPTGNGFKQSPKSDVEIGITNVFCNLNVIWVEQCKTHTEHNLSEH